MPYIICNVNRDRHFRCFLSNEMLIFLDKKDSRLVTRKDKSTMFYHLIECDSLADKENWGDIEYKEVLFNCVYNVKKDYFVVDNTSELTTTQWRTHTDLISYVKTTDRTRFTLETF